MYTRVCLLLCFCSLCVDLKLIHLRIAFRFGDLFEVI